MPERPNILVITSHDSGRWFGCYGHETVRTPGIDRLAADGVRLSQHFCASPICSASRASMLTGCYPQTHGLLDLAQPPFDYDLRDPMHHLSHQLRRAGYQTHLFGLQHEARKLGDLGFDHLGERGRQPGEVVAAEAAQFLSRQASRRQPFYMQVGFFETHTPFDFGQVEPDASRGVFVPPYLHDNEHARRTCAMLQGAIHKLDRCVGTLLDALTDSGLERDTLVIFCTDHGVELPRAKWFCYDPGIEAAMIWRWPGGGVVGGRTCDWLTSNVDFLPTLLELIGVEPTHAIDGVSYADALRGVVDARPARNAVYAYFQKAENRCVRTERYKLIRNFTYTGGFLLGGAGGRYVDVCDPALKGAPPQVQLFDLAADPWEFVNLAESPAHRDVLARLDGLLWRWMERVGDEILQGPTRTPYYEKAIDAYARWKQAAASAPPERVS